MAVAWQDRPGVRHARPASHPADTDVIKQLALDNQMFEPGDLRDFDEMLRGFFDGSLDGHQWIVAELDGAIAGAAYYAPEPFADRMWNLYFIATDPDRHGGGVGSALMNHVEAELRAAGDGLARTLIVDTSSLEGYERARAFYVRRGFVEEARIRDFYGPATTRSRSGSHRPTDVLASANAARIAPATASGSSSFQKWPASGRSSWWRAGTSHPTWPGTRGS
ncbi:MAG: N-acetyltransferase [Ilumatobacter sp.]|uniref:GNAT family N-acetyltransferase n=1 Tax=Ilumatobacter sp. TaxID=1967498 RepID=UPI002629FC65|nr:N-acetyltransferase [Ilumatobacter sp.]MDJ0770812.1 N-acetyltransferase [Ilumatobacter sp.]